MEMSDLISRSELIKFFEEHMRTTEDFREIIINIIPTIKNQSTAYDVDKVIEKLEELSDESYKAYCIAFNSDDRAEYDAYTNAIEIVKGGGK